MIKVAISCLVLGLAQGSSIYQSSPIYSYASPAPATEAPTAKAPSAEARVYISYPQNYSPSSAEAPTTKAPVFISYPLPYSPYAPVTEAPTTGAPTTTTSPAPAYIPYSRHYIAYPPPQGVTESPATSTEAPVPVYAPQPQHSYASSMTEAPTTEAPKAPSPPSFVPYHRTVFAAPVAVSEEKEATPLFYQYPKATLNGNLVLGSYKISIPNSEIKTVAYSVDKSPRFTAQYERLPTVAPPAPQYFSSYA